MGKLRKDGFYAFRYRLLLDGEPRYMSLNAALMEEQDGPVLLIGVNDIDAQVKHEQDYERKLSSARSEVNLETINQRNAESGGALVSFGMAKYDGKDSVASVFQRAETICGEGRI